MLGAYACLRRRSVPVAVEPSQQYVGLRELAEVALRAEGHQPCHRRGASRDHHVLALLDGREQCGKVDPDGAPVCGR